MRAPLLAVTALLAAAPLTAATAYHVTIEVTGDPLTKHPIAATIVSDGDNQLVSFASPDRTDAGSLLSTDGGHTAVAINDRLKTWWWVSSPLAMRPRPRVLAPPPLVKNARVLDLRTTASDEPTDEAFSGYGTRKYVVRATYTLAGDIAGAPVSADCGLTIFVWATDKIDRRAMFPAVELATRVPEIDAELAPKLAAVPGFAMKTVVVATRLYAGGAPQVETVTATVDDVGPATPPPHAFERPAGYVNQPPVVSAPGKAQ
jgi:hypothetical protein